MQVGIPKQTQFGVPKQILKMGETQVDEELFQTFLDEIHPRFNVGTYNLLEHNCNNFSDECCEFLVGKKILEHIVHLPNEVLNTPFGKAITPMLKVMENRMRNTRGQTVFAEDADAISEGRSEVLGGHAGATSSNTLPPPNTRGDDGASPRFGLQAFAQGLANAQPPNNNNNNNKQQQQQQQETVAMKPPPPPCYYNSASRNFNPHRDKYYIIKQIALVFAFTRY